MSETYYDLLFWNNNKQSKICIDNKEYKIISKSFFKTDNDNIRSILIYLEDRKLLLLSKFGDSCNTYILDSTGYYPHRKKAEMSVEGLFDILDEPYDIVDCKYNHELLIDKGDYFEIYDKRYEVYGNVAEFGSIMYKEASMVEYDSEQGVKIFIESGNLLGHNGGIVELYDGKETEIKYIVGDYINKE